MLTHFETHFLNAFYLYTEKNARNSIDGIDCDIGKQGIRVS